MIDSISTRHHYIFKCSLSFAINCENIFGNYAIFNEACYRLIGMDNQQKATLLEYMLSVSRQMVQIRSLTPLLTYAIEQALILVKAEQGYIVLLNPDGSYEFLVKRFASGIVKKVEADPVSHSILNEAIQTKKSILVRNALMDSRFSTSESIMMMRKLSIMCVPLLRKNEVIGAIYIENRSKTDQFDEDDLIPLEFFSTQAAVAIENANLNENLEQLVEERTEQLQKAKEAAEETNRKLITSNAELAASNADLDAFAHTVAHDLKNPLARVIGYSELLLTDFDQLPNEDGRKFLTLLTQSGRKMNDIIDALLLLSSVRQQSDVDLQTLDTQVIILEVINRLHTMIEQYDGKITYSETWQEAIGYSPWVEEIWINYISNALKYGGSSPTIELGSNIEDEHYVRFWVKDNGPGLNREQQAQLFTQFTRLHQTQAKGYGLGLSIVRRIAEKLGGRVGVESELGKGSMFYFTLPRLLE